MEDTSGKSAHVASIENFYRPNCVTLPLAPDPSREMQFPGRVILAFYLQRINALNKHAAHD